MPNDLLDHEMRPTRLKSLIGGGVAISIGLLLLACDPSPADRMAGVFLGVGAFLVAVGLVAPPLSRD